MPTKKLPLSPVGRLSFPKLFRPDSFNDGEPEYSVVLIFEDGTDLSGFKEQYDKAVKGKWGAKVPKGLRTPVRNCDEKNHVPGFDEGGHFVTFRSKTRPQVVDANLDPIEEMDAYKAQAGFYGRVSYDPFAYDNKGKGVSFALGNVQIIREGDPLGGGIRTEASADFGADPVAEGVPPEGEADPWD